MSGGICFSADKTRGTEAAGEDHTDLWLDSSPKIWEHLFVPPRAYAGFAFILRPKHRFETTQTLTNSHECGGWARPAEWLGTFSNTFLEDVGENPLSENMSLDFLSPSAQVIKMKLEKRPKISRHRGDIKYLNVTQIKID